MKAVIYARYSSDSQRDESIDGQIRECKEYAERNEITVLSCYIDRALSAKTDNRPEFQRMIRDSAGGLFDVVLVWKLDRFARNRYDSAHYKAILKKNGVKVVSAKEAIAEDSTGILLESLLEGYAEFYSVELSEKIHRGQKENALKGKNNGGGIPLGYVLNHQTQKLEIDPLTAPLVVEIFTRYADGETVRSIVDDLNGRGLRTRRGKPFRLNSFSALLKNRKYIGEYQYKDVVIPGGVPAMPDIMRRASASYLQTGFEGAGGVALEIVCTGIVDDPDVQKLLLPGEKCIFIHFNAHVTDHALFDYEFFRPPFVHDADGRGRRMFLDEIPDGYTYLEVDGLRYSGADAMSGQLFYAVPEDCTQFTLTYGARDRDGEPQSLQLRV